MTRIWRAAFILVALPSLASARDAHECLSEAIYFEAGSKGEQGRAAVGHTILNRVSHPEFPDTVCAVVSEGETEKKCQFSYRCDGLPEEYVYPSQLAQAQATARRILQGQVADPTGGALFFHAETIPAGWFSTRKRLGEFGGNIFYR